MVLILVGNDFGGLDNRFEKIPFAVFAASAGEFGARSTAVIAKTMTGETLRIDEALATAREIRLARFA